MLTRTHGSYPVGFLFYTNMATIRRQRRETPFVQIDKQALQDSKLSWKAKGLLAYLLSLPDDWKIYQTEISKHATDGKDSTNTAFEELLKAGYISKEPSPKIKGKFTGYDYVVSEIRNGLSVADYPQRITRYGESATTNIEYTDNKTNKEETKETPNGEHPFSKIPNLEERIGKKQYELLRKISPENLEAMRGMFHDGRVSMLWEWLEHKKTKGAYRAVNGITATVNMLKEYTPDELRKSLSYALIGNYDGWFPKKEQHPKPETPIRNLPSGQRRRID